MKESSDSTSGMNFTPLFHNLQFDTFYIEDSKEYKSQPDGVRVVEFVTRKDKTTYFIEAKRTIANDNKKGKARDAFFFDIFKKVYDTYIVLNSCNISKYTSVEQFVFVLVIPEIPDKFLTGLRNQLKKHLVMFDKISGFDIQVFNEKIAREKKWIV